jgi:hypothetical protein
MIRGDVIQPVDLIQKSNINYRQIGGLNYSMISLFDSDPVKFYEQFKLGKPKKDKKGVSIVIGDIVDFYLLDCKGDEEEFTNRFDEKFALFNSVKGSGQVFTLADTLFEITQEYTNEKGEVTIEFDTRFSEAVKKVQADKLYKGKTEDKILEDFNKNGYDYFETLMENVGKTVVDISLLDKAKTVAEILRNDSFSKDVFEEDNRTEYFPKFPVEWNYEGLIDCKSELDIIRIDPTNKKIYPRDLKTTYDNESFEYNYLKHSYYLQAAFYYRAVSEWAKQEGLEDYTIEPMEFVVGDTSSNNRRPIRYQLSMHDIHKGMYGFTVRGQRYRGVDELIKEIMWCEQNNMWNCSKNVYDNKGKLMLNLQYE